MPTIRRLGTGDAAALAALNSLYGRAFDDPAAYADAPPGADHLGEVLGDPMTVVLVAATAASTGPSNGTIIVGGLTAYILRKTEMNRSEVYIYDLAVAAEWRRRGVATTLISALKPIARRANAWVMFVQADYVDPPAIALYEKLGRREEVLHFDIAVD